MQEDQAAVQLQQQVFDSFIEMNQFVVTNIQ